MKLTNQEGASAVEFAIILPVLILLLFGAIEFGLLLYNQQVLTNASREGGRAGIARADTNSDGLFNNDDIEYAITTYCDERLITWASGTWSVGDNNPPTITITGGGDFQQDLTVRVDYIHNFIVGGIIGFNQKSLVAQTVMKMELDL